MTTKALYLLTSLALFFAGGLLVGDDSTVAYSLLLAGCLGLILYTLEN